MGGEVRSLASEVGADGLVRDVGDLEGLGVAVNVRAAPEGLHLRHKADELYGQALVFRVWVIKQGGV